MLSVVSRVYGVLSEGQNHRVMKCILSIDGPPHSYSYTALTFVQDACYERPQNSGLCQGGGGSSPFFLR